MENNKIYKFLILLTFFSISLFAQTQLQQRELLTTKEKTWIQNLTHPLKIGITQIPNQVLKDSKGYRGYSIDLFKKIESHLHMKFQYVYYTSWNKLVKAAKNREVDIIFLAQKTEKRLKLYNFTDVVLLQHNKILTLNNNKNEIEIEDLYNKKVAVVNNSAISEYIKLNFPKIKLIGTKSETDSLNLLLNKKADYTIAEPVRISYYIKKNNIENVHIAGTFPYDYKLRIATRNDIPIINIVLNKALEMIPSTQRKALTLKWDYEKEIFFDKQLLLNISIIMSIIIVFLIYLTTLNRKLKKAQKALHKINATLEQRVKLEVQKNIKKEKLMLQQSRLAQMGELLSMIAHQWKQPLNVLAILNQSVHFKYHKNKLDDDFIDYFHKNSQKQINHMSNTIDDFSNFFKPEKEKTHFCINKTIEHILEMINPVFIKNNIDIEVDTKDEFIIKGYQNELGQAILNIINNAKDALLEKDLQNKKIEISLKQSDNNIELTISDNAGGIPDELIQKIFEPYFSTKNEKKGTGIGLYMTKIIIEDHMKGKLIVQNGENGAIFCIELPITEEK